MLQISHNYISVCSGELLSFGGSQMLSKSKTMREVGCGVIAALDLLLYLCRFHGCTCAFFAQAAEAGVTPIQYVDRIVLDKLCPGRPHQGVAAYAAAKECRRILNFHNSPDQFLRKIPLQLLFYSGI